MTPDDPVAELLRLHEKASVLRARSASMAYRGREYSDPNDWMNARGDARQAWDEAEAAFRASLSTLRSASGDVEVVERVAVAMRAANEKVEYFSQWELRSTATHGQREQVFYVNFNGERLESGSRHECELAADRAVAAAAIAAMPTARTDDERVASPDMLLRQTIGWLNLFIRGMTAENWRDMKLHAERQLDDLPGILASTGRADAGERTDD